MSPLHAYDQPVWGRRLGIAFVSIVALAAAGFIGSVVGPHFKSGSTKPPPTTTTRPTATTTTTIPHGNVRVTVANGTNAPNAAAHFSQILQQQAWNVGAPANTTASASATTVYFAPGQQEAATLIAQELGVAVSAVQPLTSPAPIANAAGVDVVVVIGPDLAGNGFPATTTTAPPG